MSAENEPGAPEDEAPSDWAWALRGARAAVATPGIVLFGSYIGFGAMTHDFGWPLWIAVFSTLLVWASPAQVVLAGALAGGASLAGATLAVTVSGVRLLPMVVSIVPVLRAERTPLAMRLLAAHYVAVTAWFEGLRLTPTIPRAARMPFFLGLANTLVLSSAAATGIGHMAAGALPLALSIGLLLLTPIYFLMSLERGAKSIGERIALVLGLALAPVIAPLAPQSDILWTGLIGGAAAFLIERLLKRRKADAP